MEDPLRALRAATASRAAVNEARIGATDRATAKASAATADLRLQVAAAVGAMRARVPDPRRHDGSGAGIGGGQVARHLLRLVVEQGGPLPWKRPSARRRRGARLSPGRRAPRRG